MAGRGMRWCWHRGYNGDAWYFCTARKLALFYVAEAKNIIMNKSIFLIHRNGASKLYN
jgi:hypothetical protein